MDTNLAPYAHELNRWGTACADDCPACQWVSERATIDSAIKQKGIETLRELLNPSEGDRARAHSMGVIL